jgi:hypothetical protein
MRVAVLGSGGIGDTTGRSSRRADTTSRSSRAERSRLLLTTACEEIAATALGEGVPSQSISTRAPRATRSSEA